jgi:hypothetical protein
MRCAALFLAVLFVVTLGACKSDNPLLITRTSCPAVAVVKYTNNYAQFAPGSNFSASGLELSAQMDGVTVTCQEGKGGAPVTQVNFEVSAARASASSASQQVIPYFVTIVEDGQTILSKNVYGAQLQFADGALRSTVRQSFSATTPYVPLPPAPDKKKRKDQFEDFAEDSRPKAARYEILIGFQLTEEQAAYNVQR